MGQNKDFWEPHPSKHQVYEDPSFFYNNVTPTLTEILSETFTNVFVILQICLFHYNL